VSQNKCVSYNVKELSRLERDNYLISVIGGRKVGKTSLINQFFKGNFDENYVPTEKVEMFEKELTLNGRHCTLTIGDGKWIGDKLEEVYGTVYMYVYSVDSRASFEEMKSYIERVDQLFNGGYGGDMYGVIVANKNDLTSRQVLDAEGEELAAYYNFVFISTSAKDAEKTKAAFIMAYGQASLERRSGMVLGRVLPRPRVKRQK